jgi:eukaryotic-like serine/threonine-protein kinase
VVADLAAEYGAAGPFEHAIGKVSQALRNQTAEDEGAATIQREILRELDRLPRSRTSHPDSEPRADDPLDMQVSQALAAYASEGARAAYTAGKVAEGTLHGVLDALEAVTDDASAMARRTSLSILRQIDLSLLERTTLIDLLRLAPTPEASKAHEQASAAARERVATWVLARFREHEQEDRAAAPIRDATVRLRRLRAMLHLVDSDVGDDDPSRESHLRARWSRIASSLLRRMELGLPSALRRANAATLSRTLDALVRAEAIDPADALLVVARSVPDPNELRVLAEASMDPSLRHAISRYADLAVSLAPSKQEPERDDEPVSLRAPPKPLTREAAALDAWTRDGLLDPSSRAEALRTVVVRLHQAVSAIADAGSLTELANVVTTFEGALGSLAQLTVGARARLELETADLSTLQTSLGVDVSRVVSGAVASLDAAVIDGVRAVTREIPPAFGEIAGRALDAIAQLPKEAKNGAAAARVAEQLPGWLPPRRTLGGFYVLRPLASGGGGSVLVAVRIEERQDKSAERFALKVPSYDAAAARSVSEAEFFQMFRAEASALIALPAHPNIARFVTFDTGSKPKPILVMELVEGQNLEHEITSRALDTTRAFKFLDDVLAGLEAMHAVDVGHLDIKPSNVVLRQGRDAVLVDFGLSGRRIRPGCATGPYGAPEVWGTDVVAGASPPKADVYAFGCVAYEALTGEILFQATSELQQIALHLAHDGFPDKLRKLAAKPNLQPLAELIFSTLRRDPQKRPSVPQLRGELRRLSGSYASARWPV